MMGMPEISMARNVLSIKAAFDAACLAEKMHAPESPVGNIEHIFQKRIARQYAIPEMVRGLYEQFCFTETAGKQPVGLIKDNGGSALRAFMLYLHRYVIFSPQWLQNIEP